MDKKGKDGYQVNLKKLSGNCYFIIVGDYVITVFLRANGTPYMQPMFPISRRIRIAPQFEINIVLSYMVSNYGIFANNSRTRSGKYLSMAFACRAVLKAN